MVCTQERTVRQRLRESTDERGAKKGRTKGVQRQELVVRACFAPLLFWVLTYWPATLARWEAEQQEPWLVVTDLAAEEAQAAWYGLRMWVLTPNPCAQHPPR